MGTQMRQHAKSLQGADMIKGAAQELPRGANARLRLPAHFRLHPALEHVRLMLEGQTKENPHHGQGSEQRQRGEGTPHQPASALA